MRIAIFSTGTFDRIYMPAANQRHGHELHFLEPRLSRQTAGRR